MIEKLIKDYNHPEKPEVRVRVGRFAGFVGIFLNVILFVAKLVLGLLSGSASIVADSINNLSDAGSNVLTVAGYTVAGKPADKDHPYGHARMEYLASLFVSVIVMLLGIEMLKTSIERIVNPTSIEKHSTISIIIIASTIFVKFFMSLLFRKLGRHIDSSALKASFADSISDVIATSAVVAGMLLTPVTGPLTDCIIGCVISIYITIMGIKLVIEASNTLLGKAPDTEFIAEINRKIRSYDGVLGIHDLVVHSYGAGKTFVSAHVEVDSETDVMISHDMVDTIETDILRDMGINLVIHMDPVCMSDPETNLLRDKISRIISDMASEYSSPISMHDFRVVKGFCSQTKILFDVTISNEMPLTNDMLYHELFTEIKKINPLFVLILTIDRDYFSERYEQEE
ncbi:MAG: cation transporter [Clostridia bacterium]|nr:cation transporter [Clostridia bacterium]